MMVMVVSGKDPDLKESDEGRGSGGTRRPGGGWTSARWPSTIFLQLFLLACPPHYVCMYVRTYVRTYVGMYVCINVM